MLASEGCSLAAGDKQWGGGAEKGDHRLRTSGLENIWSLPSPTHSLIFILPAGNITSPRGRPRPWSWPINLTERRRQGNSRGESAHGGGVGVGPHDPPPSHCSLSQTPEQGKAPDKQPLPLPVQRGVSIELWRSAPCFQEKPGKNGGLGSWEGFGCQSF